jgi:hypothetical protein
MPRVVFRQAGDREKLELRLEGEVAREASEGWVEVAAEPGTDAEPLAWPWELLHDDDGYLAMRRLRVRRTLPRGSVTPSRPAGGAEARTRGLRVLVIVCRPDDQGLVAPRATVDAMLRSVAEQPVRVDLCRLGTLAALGEMLGRAVDAGDPYDIVHVNAHGRFHRKDGASLAFEKEPDESGHIDTDSVKPEQLGEVLHDKGAALVLLEACQSATTDADAPLTAGFAQGLLQKGIQTVVAMGYTVHVDATARLFGALYERIAAGATVGDALATARERLRDNPRRRMGFGPAHERADVDLRDWSVPESWRTMPRSAGGLRTRMGGWLPTSSSSFMEAPENFERRFMRTARRRLISLGPSIGPPLKPPWCALGVLRMLQHRFAEARESMLQGCVIRARLGAADIYKDYANLAEAATALGNPAEAAQWTAKADHARANAAFLARRPAFLAGFARISAAARTGTLGAATKENEALASYSGWLGALAQFFTATATGASPPLPDDVPDEAADVIRRVLAGEDPAKIVAALFPDEAPPPTNNATANPNATPAKSSSSPPPPARPPSSATAEPAHPPASSASAPSRTPSNATSPTSPPAATPALPPRCPRHSTASFSTSSSIAIRPAPLPSP